MALYGVVPAGGGGGRYEGGGGGRGGGGRYEGGGGGRGGGGGGWLHNMGGGRSYLYAAGCHCRPHMQALMVLLRD